MPSRIASFLRNTMPNVYCDHCLATALGIDRATVLREIAILTEDRRYERARGVCSLCGTVQNVITALVA